MCCCQRMLSIGFRLGKYALVVSVDDAGVHYRYDPARPESVLARSQVDDALQTAAGRKDPVSTSSDAVQRARRTLHRLLDSRACWA